jgi:cycloeucalenol cycloisomerase
MLSAPSGGRSLFRNQFPMSKNTQELLKPNWFSENPDKAWAEKFFLIYSPVWILEMVVLMALGLVKTLGDVATLSYACLMALPLIIVPLIIYPKN